MANRDREFMDVIVREFVPVYEPTHEQKLISAMELALKSTVPGRAGYPNENRDLFEIVPPEMI